MSIQPAQLIEPVVFARVPTPQNPWCTICFNTSEDPIHWVGHNRPTPAPSATDAGSSMPSTSMPPTPTMVETAERVCIIHERCLATWLEQNATCPHCRASVSAHSSPAPSQQALQLLAQRLIPPTALIDMPLVSNPRYRLLVAGLIAAYISGLSAGLGIVTSLVYRGRDGIDIYRIVPYGLTTILLGTVTTVVTIANDRLSNHSLGSYGAPLISAALTSYFIVQLMLLDLI